MVDVLRFSGFYEKCGYKKKEVEMVRSQTWARRRFMP